MSHHWLERLNQAVEYHDLHVVFSEIDKAARETTDPAGLVNGIDEAIRRIHQEKVRDQDDWDAAGKAYRRFRLKHQGICGWLRRHLPFTKTRKMEKQHIQKVADRQAELFANHLTIARAEMVKERLLPPDSRRLGHTASQWTERFSQHDSTESLRQFAVDVEQLGEEIVRSREFVESIGKELDSFAPVRFDKPENQRRKDADLAQAQDELANLKTEIQEESGIRELAISNLGRLVSRELATNDSRYRSLTNRVEALGRARNSADALELPSQELAKVLSSMNEMANERDSIPGRRDQLHHETQRLDGQIRDADRRLQQATSNHRGHERTYEIAKQAHERAKSKFNAADQRYSDYLAESGQAEMPIHDTSSFAMERNRRQDELRSAESKRKSVSPAYHASKSDVDATESELRDLRHRRKRAEQQSAELESRGRKLKSQLNSAQDQLIRSADQSRRASSVFLESLRHISREDLVQRFQRALPDQDWGVSRFGSHWNDRRELERTLDHFSSALRHIRDVQKTLAGDYSTEHARQRDVWVERCKELFGENLAAELEQSQVFDANSN